MNQKQVEKAIYRSLVRTLETKTADVAAYEAGIRASTPTEKARVETARQAVISRLWGLA